MANLLKMAIVQSILSLHAQGWSARRIAKALEVHRDTVSRYIHAADPTGPKPANAPILPGRVLGDSKQATPPPVDRNAPIRPRPVQELDSDENKVSVWRTPVGSLLLSLGDGRERWLITSRDMVLTLALRARKNTPNRHRDFCRNRRRADCLPRSGPTAR
jgi:Homeodomain-like domain